jgi:hypothetical protein
MAKIDYVLLRFRLQSIDDGLSGARSLLPLDLAGWGKRSAPAFALDLSFLRVFWRERAGVRVLIKN